MADENEKQFAKTLKLIMSGRKKICCALPIAQGVPVFNNEDVQLISEAIDHLDRCIAKLNSSYEKKRNINWS